MNILIVYDTVYGNTEKIAKAIYDNVSKIHVVQLKSVDEVIDKDFKTIDFLIMGSPTHGGWYTDNFKVLFENVDGGLFSNVQTVTFDTSTATEDNRSLYNKLTKMFGNASVRLANQLKSNGAKVIDTKIFIVEDREGPLRKKEIEHAVEWIESHL